MVIMGYDMGVVREIIIIKVEEEKESDAIQ